jgi:hypothetical protein
MPLQLAQVFSTIGHIAELSTKTGHLVQPFTIYDSSYIHDNFQFYNLCHMVLRAHQRLPFFGAEKLLCQ